MNFQSFVVRIDCNSCGHLCTHILFLIPHPDACDFSLIALDAMPEKRQWEQLAAAILENVRSPCRDTNAEPPAATAVSAATASSTLLINIASLSSKPSSRSLAVSCDAMCSAITGDAAARLTETWRSTESRSSKARAVGPYVSEVVKAPGLGWIPASVMSIVVPFVDTTGALAIGFAAAAVIMLALDSILYKCQQNTKPTAVLVTPWNGRNLLAIAVQVCTCEGVVFAFDHFGPTVPEAVVALCGWAAVAAADYKMVDFRHEVGIEDETFSVALNRLRIYSFSPAKVMLEWSNVPDDIPKDMCCPISHAPFVEPVICHNMVFEKEHLVTWIVERGEHPMLQGKRVSLVGLRPCVEMKQLVEAYASSCNMKKVVVPDS